MSDGRGGPLCFAPLTTDRWRDLVKLFGPNGACGGCWCMWWRLQKAEFESGRGAANRRALRKVVQSGEPVGVVAYRGAQPVGWCAVAPRECYPRLERSRNLRRFDDAPVWSVTCLFVARSCRGRRVSTRLLRAAADYARDRGATLLEGYPVEPKKRVADSWIWTGVVSAYRKAGFVEAHRRSGYQPIMRRALRPKRGPDRQRPAPERGAS